MYFENLKSLEEIKKEFKRLAKELHPDNGGSEEEFKKMQEDMQKAIRNLDYMHFTEYKQGTSEEKKQDIAENLKNKITAILGIDGLNIELCGCWLWVDGCTYTYRKELKQAGFKFSHNKKMWYFNGDTSEKFKRYNGKQDINDIRIKYGSITFESRLKLA